MRRAICLAALAAAIFTPPALAQHPARLGGTLIDGSVVRAHGCGSHFFIAYHEEFALAEWLGGEMVKELDVLQINGDQVSFEREGRMSFTNLATGRIVDVVIEKALMNQADFSRTVGQMCR